MEKDNRANRYSPETRARAVRMVFDNQGSYESQAAAIKAISTHSYSQPSWVLM